MLLPDDNRAFMMDLDTPDALKHKKNDFKREIEKPDYTKIAELGQEI